MNAEEKRLPIVETIERDDLNMLKNAVNKKIEEFDSKGLRLIPPVQFSTYVSHGRYSERRIESKTYFCAMLTFISKDELLFFK